MKTYIARMREGYTKIMGGMNPNHVTYIHHITDEGHAIVDRGNFDDPAVQQALAVAALSDDEHSIAVGQLRALEEQFDGIRPGSAGVRLGQAAHYAVSVMTSGARYSGPRAAI